MPEETEGKTGADVIAGVPPISVPPSFADADRSSNTAAFVRLTAAMAPSRGRRMHAVFAHAYHLALLPIYLTR
jgi:hypothetical protein